MTASNQLTLQQVLVQFATGLQNNSVFYTTATKNTASPYSTVPSAVQLLNHQDPFNHIKDQVNAQQLTTIFTNELTLLKGLPHLNALKGSPVIINVDLDLQDYSIIPALKDLAITTFISNDLDAAVKNARTVQDVALKTLSPVFHFINFNKASGQLYGKDLNLPEYQISEDVSDLDTLIGSDNFELVANKSNASPSVLIVNLSPYDQEFEENLPTDAALLKINIYRPWKIDQLLQLLPASVNKLAIVQGACKESQRNGFEPLLLDFFADLNQLTSRGIDQVILSNVGILAKDYKDTLDIIVNNIQKESPNQALFLGKSNETNEDATLLTSSVEKVLNLEQAYLKVLKQLFSSNLNILNEYSSETVKSNTPEFGFGRFLNDEEQRNKLLNLAKKSLDASLYHSARSNELVQLLSKWIEFHNENLDESQVIEANNVGTQIFNILQENQDSKTALEFLQLGSTEDAYLFKSHWLVGSDAWSYDLGYSGVHQVLSSKKRL